MNSGSSSGSSSGGTSGGQFVTIKTNLDTDADAIQLFELAASRKSGCRSERSDQDGMRIVIVNCSDGALIVAQKGRELVIGCKSSAFTQKACGDYAIAMLEYAKTGGGTTPSPTPTPTPAPAPAPSGGAGFGGGAPAPTGVTGQMESKCNTGDMAACMEAADAYWQGMGVTKDDAKAASLAQRACEGGHAKGCYRLGTFFESGVGVGKDSNKAIEWFRRGCNLGDQYSCERVPQ